MPNSRPSAGTSPEKAYCRFTPGRGQPPVDGMATLGSTGVEFDLTDRKPRHVWRYADLKTDEPIRQNTIDVLLTSREAPGASLFVQGLPFAAGLSERAPHVTQRSRLLRRRRMWFLLLAAFAGLVAAGAILSWSPTKWIAKSLPVSWRERLGNAARESMTEGRRECTDPAGLAALATLRERLSKGTPETTFDVHVYDWPLMNAFAVPGGQIVLTQGLIEKSESPDEVAGVLAHEMGHGMEMHPEAAIIRGIGLGATMEIMLGGTAGGGLVNVGVMLAQLGYSRGAEREADLHALELLKAASISPKGLGDFFTRISKTESEDGESSTGEVSWLRTHPLPAERARLVKMQHAYPATAALDPKAWENLKSVCKTTRTPDKDKT